MSRFDNLMPIQMMERMTGFLIDREHLLMTGSTEDEYQEQNELQYQGQNKFQFREKGLMHDTVCEFGGNVGVLSPDRKVCCLASCRTCGGKGCNKRKGGADGCCTGKITDSDKICSDKVGPPCYLKEPMLTVTLKYDNIL